MSKSDTHHYKHPEHIPSQSSAMDMDQHSIDTLSAMLMVQLPFPCMPIVANKGDKSSFCSSHDLLARAIAVRQVVGNSKDVQQEIAEKEQIVCTLQREVAKIWQYHLDHKTDEAETIEKCYAVFQQSFRDYIRLYPIFTTDIRFLPIQDVDSNSVISKQAISHLNSKLTLSADAEEEGAVTTYKISMRDKSYASILRAYILELWSYRDD